MSEITICDGPDCGKRIQPLAVTIGDFPPLTVHATGQPDRHYCCLRCIVRAHGGVWLDDLDDRLAAAVTAALDAQTEAVGQ